MKLHQISSKIREIFDAIGEDGEVCEDALNALQQMEVEFSTKVESTAVVISEMIAESEALDSEIKRLQGRKRVRDNNVERLKDHLRHAMQEAGEAKVTGDRYTVTLGKPGVSVAIEGDVPEQYQRVVPETRVPDKTAISKALKAGETVTGATLVEGKARILIK